MTLHSHPSPLRIEPMPKVLLGLVLLVVSWPIQYPFFPCQQSLLVPLTTNLFHAGIPHIPWWPEVLRLYDHYYETLCIPDAEDRRFA
jgi:hypothetical protein